mmetsp:Transcript_56588/g.136739  ORF Transcript_56588/g.136739 Transcript_56588/m.136739 type:complete len:89 (+) Transcript_56588:795-1061(+)
MASGAHIQRRERAGSHPSKPPSQHGLCSASRSYAVKVKNSKLILAPKMALFLRMFQPCCCTIPLPHLLTHTYQSIESQGVWCYPFFLH